METPNRFGDVLSAVAERRPHEFAYPVDSFAPLFFANKDDRSYRDVIWRNNSGMFAISDGTAPHECEDGPCIIDLTVLHARGLVIDHARQWDRIATASLPCYCAKAKVYQEIPTKVDLVLKLFTHLGIPNPKATFNGPGFTFSGTVSQ